MPILDGALFLITCCVLFVAYIFDRSRDKLVFYFSSISILFIPASVIMFYKADARFFQFETPFLGVYEYLILLLIVMSYSLAIVGSSWVRVGAAYTSLPRYRINAIDCCIKTLVLVSFLCFLVNFQRVGFSLDLLFIQPRRYEELFGRYWFVNYGYFLSVPASVMIIYRAKLLGRMTTSDVILLFLLFSLSLFHGIKYTVFDAVIFPLAAYILLHGFGAKLKMIALAFAVAFISFFSAFSYFVRGSESYSFFSFLNYIVPNYYNFFFLLNKYEFMGAWPFDGFLGVLTIQLPFERNYSSSEFLLNDKYNMLTGFQLMIASFGYLGVLVYYFSSALAFRWMLGRMSIFWTFFAAYLLFCFLMMFYGYYFGTKLKYLYYLLVFGALDFICRERLTFRPGLAR